MNLRKPFYQWIFLGLFLFMSGGRLNAQDATPQTPEKESQKTEIGTIDKSPDAMKALPVGYVYTVQGLGLLLYIAFVVTGFKKSLPVALVNFALPAALLGVMYGFLWSQKIIRSIWRYALYVSMFVLAMLGLGISWYMTDNLLAPYAFVTFLVGLLVFFLNADLLLGSKLANRFFALLATPASASSQEAATKKEAAPPATTKSAQA